MKQVMVWIADEISHKQSYIRNYNEKIDAYNENIAEWKKWIVDLGAEVEELEKARRVLSEKG